MRLMLIDDDPRYRTLLRHHISCGWPDVEIVSYNPRVRGPLTRGFLAQGFSAVLLDHAWKGGSGIDWLKDLAGREGFAPVVFLASDDESPDAVEARANRAFAVLGKKKIRHTELNDAIKRAEDEQAKAQSRWRMSAGARMAQDFAGARLKEYRRIELIAKGSVSELFLAESAKDGNVVVLKVTPAIRKETGVDQSMERFLQEFEILREVHHPNIVRIYDLGVTDDHLFLAMEHFGRGDLRKRMSEGLTASQSLTYARDLAYALEAIHEVGIFHRDLKPGNVMLRDDGSIALIDFGLAKHVALKMEVSDKGLIFGTPHYMSPEQGHGKEIDARSDIYALGVMLYEMLTGKKPFDADNHMAILVHHAKAPIPKLPERLATLQPLIDTLMAKEPANRPASAALAATLIDAALRARKAAALAAAEAAAVAAAAANVPETTAAVAPIVETAPASELVAAAADCAPAPASPVAADPASAPAPALASTPAPAPAPPPESEPKA
jgi:tRNA A-37 threonylcarbamoyl transferase component Bud32/DNA-binding NarL/FixJ family response regulator